MADTTHKPVIFLAFANDRDDTVGYLRNLPDEARRLREVLGPAVQAGLCEVEVRSNCTAGDIFKVFQDPRYRNRVAIFHYGGHANGFQLLLESAEGQSASADAGGLAAFLAQQQGLQLVFLNGCSTQSQTQGLLDANISVVLSTSRAIDDKVATDFSSQFYQGLASGATIHTAYHEAAASLQTAKENSPRGLYFGAKDSAQSQPEADRWPWNLYLREGSESADQWNLPEAVNDPLFGLPPLPKQDLPECPYRHLNWFTRKDAEVFFGRGHQIRELHDRLTAPHTAPIILFYGQSGVGKSSVLDAGLIPRLEQAYEVRYLRRAAGGLLDTLQRAFLPEADDVPLETAWRVKEEQILKPLIVFLDQVEELYTRPIADVTNELEQLLKVVKATFCDPQRRPQGKLVLSFRKEWLAELETQLAAYEIPRTKIFLEALDRRGIIEVVRGPARSARLHERYGLTVEDRLAEIIADDLLEDRDSAIAPTLQILLTKMWAKATEANYEHPQFNQELYQHLKRDGILLRDFLNQQIAAFRERYREAVDSGLLLDIVALHTTPLGTADQRSVEELREQYAHLDAVLPAILQQCQDLHLLTVAASAQKESIKTTRLVHDTLAPIVREQFDQSDKPGQRARRILDNRSVDWAVNQSGTPLDEADLKVVEHGVSGTRVWNSTEQRLVQASRELRTRLQRTRSILKVIGAMAVAVITVLGAFGWWKNSALIEANNEVGKKNNALITANNEVGKKNNALITANNEAESNAREANRQTGNAFWQVAITARDQSLSVKAAFNFLRAAQAYDQANDQIERHNVELAAQFVTSSLVSLFPYDSRVHISSNEPHVFTWGGDDAVKLWDVTKTEPLQAWKHDGLVTGAVFTHDDSRVLAWSADGAVKLWDVTKAEPLQIWKHDSGVNGAVFTRDESRVLTWSVDGAVKLWDVTKVEPLQVWKHGSNVDQSVFTRDESRVLTWSVDGAVKLWDVTKTEPLFLIRAQNSDVLGRVGVVSTRDGSRLLTWVGHWVNLWDVTKTEPFQAWKHDSYVNGAVFTRDESHVLTWSGDGAVKLWDVTKAEPLQVWKHNSYVRGAVFTRDESRVLAWSGGYAGPGAVNGGVAGEVKLWDVTKAEPLQVWKHDSAVNGAMFTRDESRVLAWSGGYEGPRTMNRGVAGEVKLWDVTKAEPLQVWKHDNSVRGAVFTRDESRVLAWSGRFRGVAGAVTLWDVTKTEPLQVWKHDISAIGAMFTHDDSRVLAWNDSLYSIAGEVKVKLWDVTKAVQAWKHDSSVLGAVFTRDDSRVLTWSGADTDLVNVDSRLACAVKLWDVTKAEPLQIWRHDSYVSGAVFTRDESRVLAWSHDGAVKLWDVTKAEPLQVWKHDSYVSGAVFTRDESRVLTWSGDGAVKLWDVTKAEPLQIWKHNDQVIGAVFTRDESRVLAWSRDGAVKLWDVTKTEPLQVWKHDRFVWGAVFAHDDSRVLAWSDDGAVKLWDVTKTEPLQVWKHHGQVVDAVFTRDESRVLARGFGGVVKLWDVTKAEPLQVWTHNGGFKGAVFTRDESRVLTWSQGAVTLWDVTKVEPLQAWKHNGIVDGAAFTRDESRVLAWGGDTVKLWDVTKTEPLRVWKHNEHVNGAVFTRDESRVLAWSRDGAVKLWDVTKAEPLQVWKHDSDIIGAMFTHDESRVLVRSHGGAVKLWDAAFRDVELIPTERITELEVRSGTRLDLTGQLVPLTSAEWRDLVRSPEYAAIQKKQKTAERGRTSN